MARKNLYYAYTFLLHSLLSTHILKLLVDIETSRNENNPMPHFLSMTCAKEWIKQNAKGPCSFFVRDQCYGYFRAFGESCWMTNEQSERGYRFVGSELVNL